MNWLRETWYHWIRNKTKNLISLKKYFCEDFIHRNAFSHHWIQLLSNISSYFCQTLYWMLIIFCCHLDSNHKEWKYFRIIELYVYFGCVLKYQIYLTPDPTLTVHQIENYLLKSQTKNFWQIGWVFQLLNLLSNVLMYVRFHSCLSLLSVSTHFSFQLLIQIQIYKCKRFCIIITTHLSFAGSAFTHTSLYLSLFGIYAVLWHLWHRLFESQLPVE